MADEIIADVLAERYATPAMKAIWSPTGKIVLERDLWIADLKAKRDLGLAIPDDAIGAYESVMHHVDSASERSKMSLPSTLKKPGTTRDPFGNRPRS